jgi:hypothetical protein
VAFPEAQKRHEWLTTYRTALWKGELDDVIAACQTHIQPDHDPDDDPAQKAVTYFSNNRHRMDYASTGTRLGLARLKVPPSRLCLSA